jgi:hypothetical protein
MAKSDLTEQEEGTTQTANRLFVIVHENSMGDTPQREEVRRILKKNPNTCYRGEPLLPPTLFVMSGQNRLSRDAKALPLARDLPPGTQILVMGAFREPCVGRVYDSLCQNGYNPLFYDAGIVDRFAFS